MADHGVNRRKSHYARMRQRIGKWKTAMSKKKILRHRKLLWNHWHDELVVLVDKERG
jgi:hypothetical protein